MILAAAFGRQAEALGIPCEYSAGPYVARGYQNFVKYFNADYVMLSGWLKLVTGLDPARTINTHPGACTTLWRAEDFTGIMFTKRSWRLITTGEIDRSAVTMHFVDAVYDRSRVFFALPVPIAQGDAPETLAAKVNRVEHEWQPRVLDYMRAWAGTVGRQRSRLRDGRTEAPAESRSVASQKAKT